MVHRKAAVVVAPMTREEKIVLICQERVPIRAAIWEMPAGQIDNVIEPDQKEIEAVALNELREEAGYELAKGGELIALEIVFKILGGKFTPIHYHSPSTLPETHSEESLRARFSSSA